VTVETVETVIALLSIGTAFVAVDILKVHLKLLINFLNWFLYLGIHTCKLYVAPLGKLAKYIHFTGLQVQAKLIPIPDTLCFCYR